VRFAFVVELDALGVAGREVEEVGCAVVWIEALELGLGGGVVVMDSGGLDAEA